MFLLDLWIEALNSNNETKKFVKYYNNLLNLFKNLKVISYEKEVREQYKNNPKSGKADPRVIQKEYARAVNEIHQRTRDIDNQNIDMFKK